MMQAIQQIKHKYTTKQRQNVQKEFQHMRIDCGYNQDI